MYDGGMTWLTCGLGGLVRVAFKVKLSVFSIMMTPSTGSQVLVFPASAHMYHTDMGEYAVSEPYAGGPGTCAK